MIKVLVYYTFKEAINIKEYRNNYLGFDIYLKDHFENFEVLGQTIKGNTGNYIVVDELDFWQIDTPFTSKEDALDYIGNLLNCRTKQECHFYKWCAKDGLREGSIIQFEDGKQGVILGKEYADGCLKYSPIKKDGTIGKSKRNLYGNLRYKVIKY